MGALAFVVGIAVLLCVTSFVIHKWFPKWKKFEPLALALEILSYLFVFID